MMKPGSIVFVVAIRLINAHNEIYGESKTHATIYYRFIDSFK